MSRRTFRASVEEPRPPAAWAMVTVASATLWITDQLAWWAIAIQAVAIGVSLWRRRDPFAWQRSPIALNIGMMGVTAATIYISLQGGPATLGLAHFASLTQGLQLIDARPRRTEFLLVALALFQVILASNLTDSVFFPPLLVAFLFATVWTLLVHTLRSEALEANDLHGASQALTPSLLNVTLVASGASVGLALVLFVMLPRLHSSVLNGSSLGASLATAGFSDHVQLGDLGRIRQDFTVVMRVETLEGQPPGFGQAYWRGLSFDHFDGNAWSVTPSLKSLVPGSAEAGLSLGLQRSAPNLVQRIVREPVSGGVLFGIGAIRNLHGTIGRLERDVNGGLYAAGQTTDRVRYTIASEYHTPPEAAIRTDDARPPLRGDGERYLQLPELSPAVAELAREITAAATTDADRVRALENYLLVNGRYTDTPPSIDEAGGKTHLEAFLFDEMAAHCEYYATALVVLSRSLGIPARLVNGFAGGRQNEIGNFVELLRSHAHAWVEVHYEQAGWVRYDATPPDLRQAPATALTLDERFRQLASAMELWWFQSIVGFDRSDQMHALKRAWLAWKGNGRDRSRSATAKGDAEPWSLGSVSRRDEALAAIGILLAAGLLWRRRRGASDSAVPSYYAQALRMLGRRGLVREPNSSAREFEKLARESLSDPGSDAFARLTECYLAERFGSRRPADLTAELCALRESVAMSRWRPTANSR